MKVKVNLGILEISHTCGGKKCCRGPKTNTCSVCQNFVVGIRSCASER